MNSLIETKGLSKYYGKGNEIKAVDSLDLTVYEGETFGLLGPNGAGKTTIVRLLNCIIKPSGGSASVKGYDILECTLGWDCSTCDDKSVCDDIREVIKVRKKKTKKPKKAAKS